MELVALLSSGKDTWAQVAGLVNKGDWDKIILIGDEFAKTFSSTKKFEFIKVDTSQRLADLKNDILLKLKGKIDGTEVALSIASGNGKEHMALISSLLSLPTGIRFTAITKQGIIYL